MDSNQKIVFGWVDSLKKRRLEHIAALLLEAANPLNILFAQLLYIGQPFFRGALPQGNLLTLASMLEDRERTSRFIEQLREDTR